MNSKIIFAIFLACIYSTNAAVAPFINKCKPDDSKCLKESTMVAIPMFGKGIPELGVEPLEPLLIKILDASTPSLKLVLKDVAAKGLSGCTPKKMQRDVGKSSLSLKLLCTVTLDGQYEMKGRILVLPIEGKGSAHVVLRKLVISVDAVMGEKVGSDGVKHWTIKSWTHSYELKDKATVELENLFNGNEVLGRAARDLISSSPNEIVMEVGPTIVKAIIARVVKSVENFFSNTAAEELEL